MSPITTRWPIPPEEKRKIEGYGHTWHEGKAYQLFCWHDIWFPVYCCFELASIYDRALFRSYADLVVAVERSSDIAYFSAIIESLCRNLHCYCIQANSSGPGDSRVLRPSKSELRDIIKTKGGKNPCILAADLDIKALRDFQRVDYNLQKENRSFKPTPLGLDHRILKQKRDGTLFNMSGRIKLPLFRYSFAPPLSQPIGISPHNYTSCCRWTAENLIGCKLPLLVDRSIIL